MQIFLYIYFLLLLFLFGQLGPLVPTGLAGRVPLSGILAAPLRLLIAIPRHAGGELKRNFFAGGGLQFVIGPVNPRTTEVRSVCAKLSARQFVCASRESQVRVCILIKCSPSACLRLLGGGMPGHSSVLCSGEFTLRAAAGLGPVPLSDGTVDPGGMENAASRERETGWVGRRGQLRASGVAEPGGITSHNVTSSQQCRGFTKTLQEQINSVLG